MSQQDGTLKVHGTLTLRFIDDGTGSPETISSLKCSPTGTGLGSFEDSDGSALWRVSHWHLTLKRGDLEERWVRHLARPLEETFLGAEKFI